MLRQIKIPYGLQEGRVTHVSEVISGLKCGCTCIGCGALLVAFKGQKQTAHFRHKDDPTCAETVLHKLGKQFLGKRIQDCLSSGTELAISWKCGHCEETHRRDLLTNVATCEEERQDGNTRPDLSLLSSNGDLLSALEIVVYHKPSEKTLSLYARKDVTCAEFHLGGVEDLEKLRTQNELIPDRVSECTMQRCFTCRSYMHNRTITVVTGDCYRCGKPMRVAMGSGYGGMFGPARFSKGEITKASKLGAELQMRYSRTEGAKYLASCCRHCHAFCGEFYIHDYWHIPGDSAIAAMDCSHCGAFLEKEPGPDGQPVFVEGQEPDQIEEPVTNFSILSKPKVPRKPKAKPQQQIEIKPPSEVAPPSKAPSLSRRIGHCGKCATPSSPLKIREDGTFLCFSCGTSQPFIPE
jgi:hypothetical protein